MTNHKQTPEAAFLRLDKTSKKPPSTADPANLRFFQPNEQALQTTARLLRRCIPVQHTLWNLQSQMLGVMLGGVDALEGPGLLDKLTDAIHDLASSPNEPLTHERLHGALLEIWPRR